MDKVYCRDCAYIHEDDYSDECHAPANCKTVDTWMQQVVEYLLLPLMKNDRNDCKDFKLVWYKRLFKRKEVKV